MELSTILAGHFSKSVRRRGDEYYLQKRVRIQEGSEFKVKARIMGSRAYTVEIEHNSDTLFIWCDCPYFVDKETPCKHLWAAILATEAEGHLPSAASAAKLALDFDGRLQGLDREFYRSPPQTRSVLPSPVTPRKPLVPPPPSWQKQVREITMPRTEASRSNSPWPAKREVLYVLDVERSLQSPGLVLSLLWRDRKINGEWSRPKALSIVRTQVEELPVVEDRQVLLALSGGQNYGYGYFDYARVPESALLPAELAAMLMPMMTRTGRCYLQPRERPSDFVPLAWDEAGPWNFGLEMRPADKGNGWAMHGVLRRGEQQMQIAGPALITTNLVFADGRVMSLVEDGSFQWICALRKTGPIAIRDGEQDEFLATVLCAAKLPPLALPEQLKYEEVRFQPRPQLKISKDGTYLGPERLRADLWFAYQERAFSETDPARGHFDTASRRFFARDLEAEKSATEMLDELGAKRGNQNYWGPKPFRHLASSKLPRLVRSLVAAGWHIEAEGKIFLRPGAFRIEVSSGVDWFELHGSVEYGDRTAKLPQLLAALRRGQTMVQLDDGTYGMLPDEWLSRIGPLAAMGELENGHIRFQPSQAGLLDALLAAEPEARCDQSFALIREQLQKFQGIESGEQPPGFVGRLRDYQTEGLGWMHFLRRFSFGGCLADDMGVGKTAQVLALIETRRELRAAGEKIGPSLVVVPRSLVFNWKQEAARFTPQLRVLDHTGQARNGSDFAAYDLVLTTYGTLRRDILHLKEAAFDYVVLDEAQAVKNADTDSSKAVRLLRGQYRLALSGTPIENHLGELWTLFEFLNPGMLGAASAFKLTGGSMRSPDEATRRLLARALRPFILRRTKEQVVSELPPKTEQTVYCEMEAAQRKLYDELRRHYRESLLRRVEKEGLAKSKIQVLEALLRLRQAACHPGLLDAKRSGDPSAKLEVLLEQLHEVLEEGHKALVFSQFTSLLKIVRDRLDKQAVTHEYLDGATHNRQARVERFQNDKDCQLFLISLKAGGLGLNLTAAEYVFILDPWWNPAVEAQAVDRAHRIGQARPVFAYRLITRDTVEEKVLELQNTKRGLAAAIIDADNSLIRKLRAEDLAILLS